MPLDGASPIPFRVVPGRGAASGRREFANLGGTIAAQKPHFAARGLDLSGFYNGTINADISPWRFEMTAPLLTYEQVRWHDELPPENFSFSAAVILVRGVTTHALVYYPRPETKGPHAPMPPDTMVELLAPPIEGLAYGDRGEIWFNPAEVTLRVAS